MEVVRTTPSGGGFIGLGATGEDSASGRLKGRVAIITGAGTISSPVHEPIVNGRAAAIAYAAEGARVMAVDIDGSAADETWEDEKHLGITGENLHSGNAWGFIKQ